MKEKDLKKGETVEWNSAQGKVEGKIVKKVTTTSSIKVGQNKTRQVKATKEDPQVVVKSAQSGKQAVHKPDALKKLNKK